MKKEKKKTFKNLFKYHFILPKATIKIKAANVCYNMCMCVLNIYTHNLGPLRLKQVKYIREMIDSWLNRFVYLDIDVLLQNNSDEIVNKFILINSDVVHMHERVH